MYFLSGGGLGLTLLTTSITSQADHIEISKNGCLLLIGKLLLSGISDEMDHTLNIREGHLGGINIGLGGNLLERRNKVGREGEVLRLLTLLANLRMDTTLGEVDHHKADNGGTNHRKSLLECSEGAIQTSSEELVLEHLLNTSAGTLGLLRIDCGGLANCTLEHGGDLLLDGKELGGTLLITLDLLLDAVVGDGGLLALVLHGQTTREHLAQILEISLELTLEILELGTSEGLLLARGISVINGILVTGLGSLGNHLDDLIEAMNETALIDKALGNGDTSGISGTNHKELNMVRVDHTTAMLLIHIMVQNLNLLGGENLLNLLHLSGGDGLFNDGGNGDNLRNDLLGGGLLGGSGGGGSGLGGVLATGRHFSWGLNLWFLFLQRVDSFKGVFASTFSRGNVQKYILKKSFASGIGKTQSICMVLNRKTLDDLQEEFGNLEWQPYVSSRKLKAEVWKYVLCPYVFGNLVSRRYARCSICAGPVYWMGSTSNLKVHFKRNHPDTVI